MNYLKNVVTLNFNRSLCTGCGRCTEVCPHEVFEMSDGKARVIDKNRCMECGACMVNCPAGAIAVNKGVGCAAAVIQGAVKGEEPSCGCSDSASSCCC